MWWSRKKDNEPEVDHVDIGEIEEPDTSIGSLLFTINEDASISVSIHEGEDVILAQQHMGNLLFYLHNGGVQDLTLKSLIEEAKDGSAFATGSIIEWNSLVKEDEDSQVVVPPSLALGIGVQFRKVIQQAGL